MRSSAGHADFDLLINLHRMASKQCIIIAYQSVACLPSLVYLVQAQLELDLELIEHLLSVSVFLLTSFYYAVQPERQTDAIKVVLWEGGMDVVNVHVGAEMS